MELRPIPFILAPRYRIARNGRVFTSAGTARRPEVKPVKALPRLTVEDAARRFHGGRRKPGEHFGLVAPPGFPPAGNRPMVWCFIHKPEDALAWGGPFIEAHGDTESGWYRLELNPGTALVHGPSIAVEAFKETIGNT